MREIPFALHTIEEDEISSVVETLRSNWITTGPKTLEFEKSFGKYIGVKNALAVNSATSGLHLALEACGVGKNEDGIADAVITTPYTFTASAEVIRYLHAEPVFAIPDRTRAGPWSTAFR